MNELFWPLLLASISGFSTMIGCLFIFVKIKNKDVFIAFSISFSLAVMLSVSIFDLIPEGLRSFDKSFGSVLFFIFLISLGGLLIYFINRLISKKIGDKGLYKLGILSFIALILHNLPEGILTFMSTYKDFHLGVTLCFAIALHNIPEGISIAVPIYYGTGDKKLAIKNTFLSSLAEPVGAILTYLILKNYITDKMISIVLILVAGIMITLSIEKMLPEALSYKKNKPIYLGLILGFVIVLLSLLIL